MNRQADRTDRKTRLWRSEARISPEFKRFCQPARSTALQTLAALPGTFISVTTAGGNVKIAKCLRNLNQRKQGDR